MIKIDGSNFEVARRDGANSSSEMSSVTNNKGPESSESGRSPSVTSLSDRGVRLSHIDKELGAYLRENPLPRYFSNQTHNDRVASKAQSLSDELGIQLDDSDIEYLVESNAKQSSRPSIDNGNVFDFLTESDRRELEEAHKFALENGTSLDDVEHTAFEVGVKRRREAMEAQGTRFAELDKDADFGAFLLNIERGGKLGSPSKLEAGSKEYQQLIERFSDNPIIMEIFSRITLIKGR